MNSIRRFFTIMLLLSLTEGCAYFHMPNTTAKPTVALVDISLKKANLLEQLFIAELRIDNPNNFDLPIDGVEAKLALEDQKLGEGEFAQHFTVPANGSAQIKMKIRTNLFSNLKMLKKIVHSKQESVHYRLTGKIDIDLPLFLQDVHFETNDAIAVPNLKL